MTSIRFRTGALGLALSALSILLVSCGGSSTPATPTPSPTPTPVPQPTPTPAPSPSPSDDRSGYAPGPVVSVKVYLKTVESSRNSRDYRLADKDSEGRFILYVGEFVVVDSTQRNAADEICQWRHDPIYYWDNFDDMMDIKGSSEPFFFKFEVARPGIAEVSSSIDGVPSNDLKMVAIRRPN